MLKHKFTYKGDFLMSVFNIVIPLFFIVIILKQLKYMKQLIIPTRKNYVEIIILLLCVIIILVLKN